MEQNLWTWVPDTSSFQLLRDVLHHKSAADLPLLFGFFCSGCSTLLFSVPWTFQGWSRCTISALIVPSLWRKLHVPFPVISFRSQPTANSIREGFCFSVLGTDAVVMHMLDKLSIIELHLQLYRGLRSLVFFLIMHMCVCLCEFMCTYSQVPREARGCLLLEAGVIGSCNVPGVGAGNQILASTRVVSSLTCWTVSPASIPLLFQVFSSKELIFLFIFIIFILVFNNLLTCFHFCPIDDKPYRSRNVTFHVHDCPTHTWPNAQHSVSMSLLSCWVTHCWLGKVKILWLILLLPSKCQTKTFLSASSPSSLAGAGDGWSWVIEELELSLAAEAHDCFPSITRWGGRLNLYSLVSQRSHLVTLGHG